MNITSQIKQPILIEMELFEKKFYESMSSKVALLNRITYYIVNRKGKQMRPMFVFLTAKMVSEGKVNERTYRGACVIELIHTATLVHDDVVDDSNERRGFFSVNALWKNKIAVLVGDFLLAKGLLLGGDNYLPQSLKEAFTRVGLSHMIAVSGYNIMLIAQMLLFLGLACGLWRKQALWFALVGIVFFIIMIGLPASAARAGAMAGIVFVALEMGRLARPVRTLIFALGVMLLFNPLLLRYDIGLELSFLATLGILLLMPYYERLAPKNTILKKGGEVLYMTVAVELFVLPIILLSFHTFSLFIIVGNFLVILVPLAMIGSFVSALLFLFIPGAEVIMAWAAFGVLTMITRSVEWLGALGGSTLVVESFSVWHLVLWYVILGVTLLGMKKYFPVKRYAQ